MAQSKKMQWKIVFFLHPEIKSILEKGAGNMSWNHCDDTLIRQLDNVNDMSVLVQDGNRGIAATRLSGRSLSKCFKPINLQLEKDMHTRPKSNLVSLVFSSHLENIHQNWNRLQIGENRTYLKPPPGFSCIVDSSLCERITRKHRSPEVWIMVSQFWLGCRAPVGWKSVGQSHVISKLMQLLREVWSFFWCSRLQPLAA